MIRLGMIWGLARAEARLTRRLVRYWLFAILGLVLAGLSFANFLIIYRLFSSGSASAASINPRYFLANAAAGFLVVFYVGLIFLAFEVRARDERERIVDVLDARPVSNVELLAGRALGLTMTVWVSLVIVVGLMALIAWLFKAPFHGPSIVTVLVFFTIPALVFMIGVIFLTTILVRHRLVAAILALALIGGSFATYWITPFWMAPIFDAMGVRVALFPSDIAPQIINFSGLVQRIGYLLMGFGLIGFAVVFHPRRDGGSRVLRLSCASALLVVGFGLCAWLAFDTKGHVEQQMAWAEIHRDRLGQSVPDLVAVRGNVEIEPQRAVTLDIEMTLNGTEAAPSTALFTFNPGMTIDELSSSSGPLEYTHEDGLLEISLNEALLPGRTETISLIATGVPDPWFAYLDATENAYLSKGNDAQIFFLGYETFAWHKSYVALMPGVRWLPTTGPDIDRGSDHNPYDYFTIDLTFDVPGEWLAAGPGRRVEIGREGDRVTYRYAPSVPLPEVCLIAGRFESVSTEIEGVTVETLLHPAHAKRLEFFEDAADEIRTALTERLTEAAEAGLAYPYDALTLVEVPIALRGYGGGWRMDTTFAQPAMILTRENSFPTAWFEGGERWYRGAEDREGGLPRAKRQQLETFFENDFNGGNVFTGAARSFFGYQTDGTGPEAIPMDYVLEQLTSQTISDRRGFFSVHFFQEANFGNQFQKAGMAMSNENRKSDNYAEVLIDQLVSTNKIWDAITQVKLSEIDPRRDPEETVKILALKGSAMADSMLDGMGRSQAGRFLGALRDRGAGRAYTREDILLAGSDVGEDLTSWLDLWIDQTDLPGFWVDDIQHYRITDDETNAPRYQLLVTIHNGEEPAGLVRLEYRTSGDRRGRQRSAPITIPGKSSIEIGLVLSDPLDWLRVSPYLALNREPFNVAIPTFESDRLIEREPFNGERLIAITADETGTLIIDDLDAGFSIEGDDEGKGLRATGSQDDRDLDAGLPPIDGAKARADWSRYVHPDAYGKYRRTTAIVRQGKGEKKAVFSAEIPRSGRWELSFHLPAEQRSGLMASRRDRGSWKLVLDDGTGTQDIEFDAETNDSGWNSLGVFDIAGGTVRLIVSNETEGAYVLADAIRWTPEARSGEQVAKAQ